MSWKNEFPKRLGIEILLMFFTGAIIGVLFTVISWLLFGYRQALGEVFLNNALIAAVTNLFISAGIEAFLFYRQNQQSLLKAEILENENLNLRFDMLKKQLDPHFLFNSLNILSSLIRRDREKSQDFIDAFSFVYRYTLEVLEKPVISLREELEFAEAYLYLHQIRFEDAFSFEISIADRCRERLIPPLALQILLENAFKHNVASRRKPLKIRISCDPEAAVLFVANNIQSKIRLKSARSIGLENLRNRYSMVSSLLPEITRDENEYIVKLPLIKAE